MQDQVDLSRFRLEICLGIINQVQPSVFALQIAQDMIASDVCVRNVLAVYGIGLEA